MLQMSSGEIGAFLQQQETGVLSLCSDGDPYGVPESFGYLDGTLYFELLPGPESRKMSILAENERVSFTVYEASSADDFASVVVEGPLRETDPDTAAIALGQNDQFPSSGVFVERDGSPSPDAYELVPETVSGRKGEAFEIEASLAKPERGENESD